MSERVNREIVQSELARANKIKDKKKKYEAIDRITNEVAHIQGNGRKD